MSTRRFVRLYACCTTSTKELPVPHRDTAPVGGPCWADLLTHDKDTSVAFYTDIFGWDAQDMGADYGGYVTLSKNGETIAGLMANTGQPMPDFWGVYLASVDTKESVDNAVAHGAAVIVPPMDVMDLGVMAVVTDPSGAGIGIWQPKEHQGFTLFGEPGAPSWFELHTRNYDAALPFYRDVFGWNMATVSDVPEFRYSTLGEGEDGLAGVMDASGFLPEGVPSSWTVYFGVESADATLARITELGGAVVQPAEDTPYGRLAGATDPTGAYFKLRQTA
jgi:predicted enzyme related to lactoylglutathione lyase